MQDELKAAMRAGRPAVGFWCELFSPAAAEIMASAGYDCVMIDCEHGPGDTGSAIEIMRAIDSSGCTPLVRVPGNDQGWIKRLLDAGARGVMVPAVNSAAEAEAAVAACHYPPRGVRGMAAPIVRASGYGRDWQGYVRQSAESLLVICQIESKQALDCVDAIAAIEQLDMIFIGPFDLSASLGFMGEPDHPEVRRAITEAEKAAKAQGCLLGGIPTPERPAQALYEAGYDLVLADMDVVILRDGAMASVSSLMTAAGRR
ncbi:HpcH/HpaI aldolase family protein [Pelagibius sp.]|uniref:HpcH/HpaI aldolase family protein n=2 Tax=Pelagibius sp. TaxID=1931238 RepID=UPI003BAFAE99